MDTFELAGPERLPCDACAGTGKVPQPADADPNAPVVECQACDGLGTLPQMHPYAVVKHKATEGMPLAMACGAVVSGYVERLKASGKTVDDVDQNEVLFEMIGAMTPEHLRLMFRHTTRDGLPVEPDVAYDNNYQEMIQAVAKIGALNSFFGRRSSG